MGLGNSLNGIGAFGSLIATRALEKNMNHLNGAFLGVRLLLSSRVTSLLSQTND